MNDDDTITDYLDTPLILKNEVVIDLGKNIEILKKDKSHVITKTKRNKQISAPSFSPSSASRFANSLSSTKKRIFSST